MRTRSSEPASIPNPLQAAALNGFDAAVDWSVIRKRIRMYALVVTVTKDS